MNKKKREQRKLIIGGVFVLFLLGAVAVLASQLGVFKGDQRSKADGPCSMPANSSTEFYCANGNSYQHTCSGTQCAGDPTKICGTWGTETLGGNACGGTGGGGGTPAPTGGTGGGTGGGGSEPYGKNWGNACSGVGYGACNAGSRCVGGSQCGSYNCFKVDPSCGSATICTAGQCVKATSTTYRKCNISGSGWTEYGTDSTCGRTSTNPPTATGTVVPSKSPTVTSCRPGDCKSFSLLRGSEYRKCNVAGTAYEGSYATSSCGGTGGTPPAPSSTGTPTPTATSRGSACRASGGTCRGACLSAGEKKGGNDDCSWWDSTPYCCVKR